MERRKQAILPRHRYFMEPREALKAYDIDTKEERKRNSKNKRKQTRKKENQGLGTVVRNF